MKLAILLCLFVALAFADIISGQASEPISRPIKDVSNSNILGEENDDDVIVEEDGIKELVHSDESEIEADDVLKDDNINKDSIVKLGNKVRLILYFMT